MINVNYMYGNMDDIADDTSITITKDRYNDLIESEAFLEALEAAGVDNWEGYSLAEEIFAAFNVTT